MSEMQLVFDFSQPKTQAIVHFFPPEARRAELTKLAQIIVHLRPRQIAWQIAAAEQAAMTGYFCSIRDMATARTLAARYRAALEQQVKREQVKAYLFGWEALSA